MRTPQSTALPAVRIIVFCFIVISCIYVCIIIYRYSRSVNVASMSVTSLQGGDGITISAQQYGEFLGERTIAAYVTKDNYRTTRDLVAQQGLSPKDGKKFGRTRKLWLQVIWQKASNDQCKAYEVKPGEVLMRYQDHLEQFEVFRASWRQEPGRRPLSVEWPALAECYIQTDC